MLEFLNFQYPFAAMLLSAGGSAALNCVGAVVARPLVRWIRTREAEWNGVVGAVLSCFGVFYGLLLGLLAVAAYQVYETAESRVTGEASLLAGIYGDLRDYPQPVQSELHGLVREYTRVTVEEDWPSMHQGQIPAAGTVRMRQFMQKLHAFQPTNPGQEVLHASVVKQCATLRDLRRHRLYTATVGLPKVLWSVVVLGGILNLVLLWLLDMRLRNQLLLGSIVSVFLGTVVCVIALMNNPFRGALAIEPEPMRVALELVMTPKKP